jgi:hypothetical protein
MEIKPHEAYPGQGIFLSILDRAPLDQIVERISLRNPDEDRELKNAERWRESRPVARNAWLIGEALRYSNEEVPRLMRGAGGLMALYWFRHLADLVGVLGSCNPRDLTRHEDHLMALLGTIKATEQTSRYDVLPVGHAVLNGNADAWLLRLIADSGILTAERPENFEIEADRLNDRDLALGVWTLPDDVNAILDAGAKKWFVKGPRGENPFRDALRPLRFAYAMAKYGKGEPDVIDLIVDLLRQWFYEIVSPRPPDAGEVEFWASLVSDPTSFTAGQARATLRSYIRVAESQIGIRVDDATVPFDEILRHVADVIVHSNQASRRLPSGAEVPD